MSIPPFQYTAQFLASMERTLPRERLKRYLAATGQDIVKALELYEDNVALSEALYGYLHGLEVTVRNAMHHELTLGYNTPSWYDRAPLFSYHQDKIQEAKREAGPHASAGKIIAELTFAFWTGLIAHRYHWALWVPHLNKAFPNARKPRSHMHARLQTIQRLRNRIAHHEPILTSQNRVYAGHQSYISLPELAECAEWICRDTAQWLRAQSRYRQAETILSRVHAMGVVL